MPAALVGVGRRALRLVTRTPSSATSGCARTDSPSFTTQTRAASAPGAAARRAAASALTTRTRCRARPGNEGGMGRGQWREGGRKGAKRRGRRGERRFVGPALPYGARWIPLAGIRQRPTHLCERLYAAFLLPAPERRQELESDMDEAKKCLLIKSKNSRRWTFRMQSPLAFDGDRDVRLVAAL